MTAWTMAEPHARAAGVAAGGEEGVEDLFAVRFGYRIAVIADGHLDGASSSIGLQPHALRVVADGVVGQMRQHDQRFLAGHADRAVEASGCGDGARREPALQSADHLRRARCARSAARFPRAPVRAAAASWPRGARYRPECSRRNSSAPSASALSVLLCSDSSSNSAAPLIDVSGDFSSWVRCAEKVAM